MCTKKCNLCRSIKWSLINNSYYDVICSETNRVLENYVKIGEAVQTPFWCPFNDKNIKTWHDLTPQVVWENIKEGDLYHLPPIEGKERRDIKVTNVSKTWFSYIIENSTVRTIYYMYPSDKEFKFLVKHR